MNSPYMGNFKVTQTQHANHDGLDLVGLDSKEIHSTITGTVMTSGWENANNRKQGFGLYVVVLADGANDFYFFGHLSETKVNAGQKVKITDIIGMEGSTGNSTGSHLHYCVRRNRLKTNALDISAVSGIPNKLGTYKTEVVSPDIFYRVKTQKHGWLSEARNLNDYAGWQDSPITDIAIKVSQGGVKYRVHVLGGGWLPYVTGYNISDYKNGYAGNGKPIDAIEVIYTAPNGGIKKAKYRVAPVGGNYYSWQVGNEKTSGQDGYAGVFGKKISKIQMSVE